jgi:ABC-type branched-subunit amino acid transport system substrate-binding protein
LNVPNKIYPLKKIFAMMALLIVASPLFAQDFKRQFKDAKEFYEDKKYNFAMDGFKPLMVYDRMNPYTEYASFYFALSAYHQNYFAVAKETLLQIKKLYPEWDQLDEVSYWLAAVYFKDGEYFQALRMLADMKSPRNLASMEAMKNFYLFQLYDEEVIRLILEEFPGETALLKRLINRKIGKGEYAEAKDWIGLNGLDTSEFQFPENRQSIFKEKYRVAVLLPFLVETLEPSPGTKRNQSTLDLYQGMRMATDSLASLGINIELVGYDTERQPEKVAKLFEMQEMQSADVLIGPLFLDELSKAAEFSIKHQIALVNPISNSADYVRDNPNAILLQPDFYTIGLASAEALAARKINKPTVVFYGDAVKDSIMAFSFLKRAQELNLTIALFKKISKINSEDVYSILVNPTKYDRFRNPIEFKLKKDSIGSIFVASDDELIFTKVISSIDRRADSVIIVGQDSWIDKPSMDYDKFERMHIMMSSPSFTDVFSPEYQQFRKRYAARFGVMPTPLSKIGFESFMFLCQSLKVHGNGFVQALGQSGDTPASLGKTYRFEGGQCNRKVPFVIFEDGELRALD